MIIGLAGKAGTGKDTAGAYLIKQYGFERIAFADKLKQSFASLFDIPPWELEKLKNDPTAFVGIGHHNEPDVLIGDFVMRDGTRTHRYQPAKMWLPIREHTVRKGHQRYGDESHRQVFGYDFWLDVALPVGGYYAGRKIVVTDVRYDNEAERIRELDGRVIQLIRNVEAVNAHSSEVPISAHLVNISIVNNGTLMELYSKIDGAMVVYENLRS